MLVAYRKFTFIFFASVVLSRRKNFRSPGENLASEVRFQFAEAKLKTPTKKCPFFASFFWTGKKMKKIKYNLESYD